MTFDETTSDYSQNQTETGNNPEPMNIDDIIDDDHISLDTTNTADVEE